MLSIKTKQVGATNQNNIYFINARKMKNTISIILFLVSSLLLSQKLKTENNQNNNISKAFEIVVQKWETFEELKSLEKYINHPKELQKFLEKNESTKDVKLFTTKKYLIASYNEREVGGEHYTIIISLNDLTDLKLKSDKFFVDSYSSKSNILSISRNGYDSSGRYWQNGTYNLTTNQFVYNAKEY